MVKSGVHPQNKYIIVGGEEGVFDFLWLVKVQWGYIGGSFGLFWRFIGVILAVHWGYIAVHWGYIFSGLIHLLVNRF